jgi:hypothetical protein
MPLRKVSNRKTVARKPAKDPEKKKESKRGNPPVVETYEDARENAMINRNVPTMKEGGYCKGGGAAIKGTNFKGVF